MDVVGVMAAYLLDHGSLQRIIYFSVSVPYLRQCTAVFELRRSDFNPRVLHVGYVVNEVALGQVFLPALWFSSANYHSSHLDTYLSLGSGTTDSLETAIPRDTVGPHCAVFLSIILEQHLANSHFTATAVVLHRRRINTTGPCTDAESTPVVPVPNSRIVCVPWGIFILR